MPLIIGDAYTLKIGICDTGDPYFDSSVFINSQSVNSTYDCPLLSANIGDACESTGSGTSLVTADCACATVTQTPDIVVNASFDNLPYFAEDTIHLNVNTFNFSSSVYPDYEINIYTSLVEEFNPATSTLQATLSADELAALESVEANFAITDFNYPVSSLPYFVIVDIPAAPGEIVVENNRAILSFTFEDNNSVCVSLTPQYSEMTLLSGQTSFDFSYKTYNPGPNYLTESPVNLYWFEDSIYNESDILISEYQGPGMNIGGSLIVNILLNIPQPTTQNPYYVLVVPQPIVVGGSSADYAVAKIQFSTLSTKSIDKTDWTAWFDENKNLIIQPGNDANGVYTFSLFDQLGREVVKRNAKSGSQTTATQGLSSGVYMLQIETGSQLISAKLALIQ